MSKKWTKEEINLLKETYSTSSKEEILTHLPNRTYTSIQLKASRLGLEKTENILDGEWTSYEINFLEQNYKTMSNVDLGNKFNRSIVAVRKKLWRLGLKRESNAGISGRVMTDEWKRNISKGLISHYEINPPKSVGSNHYAWKGGITHLTYYMRNRIAQWKRDSLEYYSFKCVITGENSSYLEVHHLYSFSKILEETLAELSLPIIDVQSSCYSDEQLRSIEKLLLVKHYEYGYGVPLLPSIHAKFHSVYGKGNNTPEQFNEFRKDYENGKYENKILEEVK